ncbi:hypothetical protein OIU84_019362 [Salix udensis]|uniref:EF-hand domain-containing protein n=1 Tax=Salix udensis TaxID=889485 RepID=A0AAD6PIY8_9ROSI|nr:hypothetical protein OIU84_019362 [Salix udensis]
MCPSGTSLAAETKRGGAGSGFSRNDADDDVIGSMMSVADFNKDGFVEYAEFERVLDGFSENKKSSSSTRSTFGVMEDVFRVMDKDGDGKLSADDLKSYMQWGRV